jgi:tRNA(Met) C34 N-acetyltransferase TmcA
MYLKLLIRDIDLRVEDLLMLSNRNFLRRLRTWYAETFHDFANLTVISKKRYDTHIRLALRAFQRVNFKNFLDTGCPGFGGRGSRLYYHQYLSIPEYSPRLH